MKDENYNYLMMNLKAHDEQEELMIINNRIDEIISKSSNPKFTLEALICMFESKNNLSTYYAIMAIIYSSLIMAISLVPNLFNMSFNSYLITIFVMAIIGIVLLIFAGLEKKSAEVRVFILNVLKFRYEELNREIPKLDFSKDEIKKTEQLECSEYESIYIVKVKKE